MAASAMTLHLPLNCGPTPEKYSHLICDWQEYTFEGPLNSTCIQTALETRERGSKQICQEASLDSGQVWPPADILKHTLFHSASKSVVRTTENYLFFFVFAIVWG